MRVKVDRDLCISAASCIALLPEVFELDDEGKAVIKSLKNAKTSDWTLAQDLSADSKMIIEAARSCPTNAIIVEDDDGKQIYP